MVVSNEITHWYAYNAKDTEVAPVWSASSETEPTKFIGALTTHNFLLLLQKLYKESASTDTGPVRSIEQVLASLDSVAVADLLEMSNGPNKSVKHRPGFSFILPEKNLFDAARLLVADRTHTLILTDFAMDARDDADSPPFMSVLSTFYSYCLVQFIASNVRQELCQRF